MSDQDIKPLVEVISRLHDPQVVAIDGPASTPVQILLRPSASGVVAQSLKPLIDEYRLVPERLSGTSEHQTLGSFIAATNRFKTPHSVLYALRDMEAPAIQAVFDYHKARAVEGLPQDWLGHSATHNFPLSDEWIAWKKFDGRRMSQAEFASFLEDRILDVLPVPVLTGDLSESDQELARIVALLNGTFAGPERLAEMARGLAVHESSQVANFANLSTGEGSITFNSEHTDGAGERLSIPNLFCVGIPVFEDGDRYRVIARLRYRKQGPGLVWFYELYRADRVFKDAFDGACADAATKTELPLFFGTPERPA